jgi:hypothetical protein
VISAAAALPARTRATSADSDARAHRLLRKLLPIIRPKDMRVSL